MSLRFQHLRQILRFLPCFCWGNHYQQYKLAKSFSAQSFALLPHAFDKIYSGTAERGSHSRRYSTIPKGSKQSSHVDDILSFIKSALNEPEGPHHCWLNKIEGDEQFSKRDGTFMVLAGRILDSSQMVGGEFCDPVSMFEKVKALQQRLPHLSVMGFQPGYSISSAADRTDLFQLIMKEYITFPILLSRKNFFEIENGICFILFKDFRNPLVFNEKSLDVETLIKAVEGLNTQDNKNFSALLQSSWVKLDEGPKESQLCFSMQNLLLYFPGCISTDEGGERLFLSDSNHHRIIIFDGNGNILDCIGSCPGFEDGDFESAKMARPAASFYDEDDDCLYIVDSENHAIRRADLVRRVLETLYPTSDVSKGNGSLWSWITNKLGFGINAVKKPEEFDSQSLLFPWHLLKSGNVFIIINRSFEMSWVMDVASGEIKQIFKGFPKILEFCGEMIMEKLSLLNQMPCEWLEQQTDGCFLLKGYPYAGLISSFTTFQNQIVMCDTVGQRVLKLSRESGVCSDFQFSNFGILGLPYWFNVPLERVYAAAKGLCVAETHHLQRIDLLPGRVDMQLNVDIPLDFELIEPLNKSCIWQQARGAATVFTGAEGVVGSTEKVGVAQQFYDELDNLAFSDPVEELNVADTDAISDLKTPDDLVHIDCTVNTSPGESEVIISAALYLRLRSPNLKEESQEKYAARIADILNPDGGIDRDSCIAFLLKSKRDLRDLIFMKPLHVRIKLVCLGHPKAHGNSKEIVVTHSSINFGNIT
ncbi:uncharacterized protein LOC120000365 isoform X1 [Tripterygium wilfordii]|uniref:uncharacterized protein LOC120000365 isoform X1 n=1 Tax=Tripterygium wilfordii TaxID=458696 RepID=UPI0018F85A1E|nr:uncharacterized protein LOC120000365 isoform X1 [Tripterygium wilfordii]XP_038704346.1 uncharacterized protein LOC120000365 isoform X1 [Tripterygium wilfordii]XP_038704347.1 uncharacterized protein LOC120000365 isoform X1 [Tripterygium wilfordii]XP_038704348.1 uncharacterized protein LOC120000365 isoform X1 [Tripterygium wilfordii]XP_038704349.1 uncharacterized protein LOC120000365 isoform X1 [Tripterygium wilfordii]XP_038704350.1 uncharacterized protein LOC120000365 isoform X1 [Tripterygiu